MARLATAAEKAAKYRRLLTPNARLAASKAKGRHLKAALPLEAGSTVVVETAAAYVLLKHSMDELCLHCLCELPYSSGTEIVNASTQDSGSVLATHQNQRKRGIVCPGCIKQTYYCSEECRKADSKRHTLECPILRDLPGITAAASVDYSLFRLVLAVLVRRRLEAESAGDSVKGGVYDNESVAPPTGTEFVFDLISHRRTSDPLWLACVEACASDFARHLPQSLAIPEADIVGLACKINANSHAITDPTGNTNQPVACGLFPAVAMLNHSCAPNCSFVAGTHAQMVVRTLHPVSEGEELCVAYVDLCLPRDERRGKLLESKRFWCMCERCESADSSEASDARLDGVLCPTCSDGSSLCDASRDFQCPTCATRITADMRGTICNQAETCYNDAYDLFKARHTDSALIAFQNFIDKFKSKLHPQHYLFINANSLMASAAMKQHDFVGAAKHGQSVLDAMGRIVPQNWPELADFWYRQAEVLEIVARAVQECNISAERVKAVVAAWAYDEADVQSVASAAMAAAGDAYAQCAEMRAVAYGESHAKTAETRMQLARVRQWKPQQTTFN
ncbi:hypothetical protein HDU82_000854 [Entophlyctis luteolus]|nr:hypothetical protein HDU82_000854 [Entophlyctis luteolus]